MFAGAADGRAPRRALPSSMIVPAVEHEHARGELLREAHLVRDDDDREALGARAAEQRRPGRRRAPGRARSSARRAGAPRAPSRARARSPRAAARRRTSPTGYAPSRCDMPTFARSAARAPSPRSRAWPFTWTGASITLPSAVRCAKRCHCWKTKPDAAAGRTRAARHCAADAARARARGRRPSPTPLSNDSRPFMQRSSVLLPPPDGPDERRRTSPRSKRGGDPVEDGAIRRNVLRQRLDARSCSALSFASSVRARRESG